MFRRLRKHPFRMRSAAWLPCRCASRQKAVRTFYNRVSSLLFFPPRRATSGTPACSAWSNKVRCRPWCGSWPCSRSWLAATRTSGCCGWSANRSTSRSPANDWPPHCAVSGLTWQLAVEVGRVTDCPARRISDASAERQLAAEKIIIEDPFVQRMMRDFGAKIVPGSIKPL